MMKTSSSITATSQAIGDGLRRFQQPNGGVKEYRLTTGHQLRNDILHVSLSQTGIVHFQTI